MFYMPCLGVAWTLIYIFVVYPRHSIPNNNNEHISDVFMYANRGTL